MAIVATVAESMAVVSTVQPGVSLGLRCGLSLPLAIVGKGGDNGGVLLHDGLANGVGDGLVGDGLRGRDNGRGSIREGSIGVADNGTNNSRLSLSFPLSVVSVAVRVAVSVAVAESMAVVSSVQEVRVSLSLRLSLSFPLAIVSVCVGVSVSITVAEAMAIVSSVQEVRVSLSLGVSLGGSLGSHCQQKKSGKRHCSSVVSLDCPHVLCVD